MCAYTDLRLLKYCALSFFDIFMRLWRNMYLRGAKIILYGFAYYPLIHRRRDDGPPSPQRLLRNRGKVGMGVINRHDDGPPSPQG